jgi:hypothetical protein
MSRLIVFISIILTLGCQFTNNKFSCKWKHSQIVGHRSLMEANKSIVGLFIGIECNEQQTNETEYVLSVAKKQIEIRQAEKQNNSNVSIFELTMSEINDLLGKQILDSIQYKEELKMILEKSTLKIKGKKVEIPKSINYEVIYGYKIKYIK